MPVPDPGHHAIAKRARENAQQAPGRLALLACCHVVMDMRVTQHEHHFWNHAIKSTRGCSSMGVCFGLVLVLGLLLQGQRSHKPCRGFKKEFSRGPFSVHMLLLEQYIYIYNNVSKLWWMCQSLSDSMLMKLCMPCWLRRSEGKKEGKSRQEEKIATKTLNKKPSSNLQQALGKSVA